MSVTFSIRGEHIDWESENIDYGSFVNLSNSNACLILDALGVDDDDLCGELRGRELAKLCLVALSQEQPEDAEVSDSVTYGAQGARMIECGRNAGYVTERLQQLLALAQRAGDIGVVTWG